MNLHFGIEIKNTYINGYKKKGCGYGIKVMI